MATLQKFKLLAGSPTRSPVIHLRRRKTLRMFLSGSVGGRRLPDSTDRRGNSNTHTTTATAAVTTATTAANDITAALVLRNKIVDALSVTANNKDNKKISSRYSTRRGCYGVPVIRASRVIETEKVPSDIRKRTMDAVDACGGRVTMGDVVSKAGINLSEAQKALQALAADTHGFLEVSDEGDVLYVFPKDYRSKLAAKSLWIKYEPLVEKAKYDAEYIVRVSFGTALFASIVLVFTAIIVILSSTSDEDNRDKRGRRSGFNLYLDLSDLVRYLDASYYWRRKVREDNDGMNFVESIFSFVFGDGDPNQGFEKKRWKLIGQYIASNGSVTTAEELAPYLDIESTVQMNDDSYILPVLLRFDGQPVVDEQGNILYRFPSMQRTAFSQKSEREKNVGRNWADRVEADEKFFMEKQWQFSKTSTSKRLMVIGLGALNLFGVVILGDLLRGMTVTRRGFITFVSYMLPLLQIYAGSFFVIPFVRQFFILKTNAEIEKRNHAREQHAQALELPHLSLRRKLLSARNMANRTFIGQDRVVYTTGRDLIEQDYKD